MYEGAKVRLVHLNESAVNLQLGSQPAAHADPIPLTSETTDRPTPVAKLTAALIEPQIVSHVS